MGISLLAAGIGTIRMQSWVLYAVPIWMTSVLTGGSAILAFTFPEDQQLPLVARIFAFICILAILSVTLFNTQILWKPSKRRAFLKSFSPKRQDFYTFRIAPLGVFLSCFGFNLFSAALLLPTDNLHSTLVESPEAKRILTAFVALFYLLIGIGFIRMWFFKRDGLDQQQT